MAISHAMSLQEINYAYLLIQDVQHLEGVGHLRKVIFYNYNYSFYHNIIVRQFSLMIILLPEQSQFDMKIILQGSVKIKVIKQLFSQQTKYFEKIKISIFL